MKFTDSHLESLESCIKPLFETNNPIIIQGDKSEQRYLWDIFWESKWTTKFRDHYNEGDYLDTHIQTAIKNIVKKYSI